VVPSRVDLARPLHGLALLLRGSPHFAPIVATLFATHAFHACGRAPVFSALPFAAPFVGFDGFVILRAAPMLLVSTAGPGHGALAALLASTTLAARSKVGDAQANAKAGAEADADSDGDGDADGEGMASETAAAAALALAPAAAAALCSSVFCLYARRELMVWAIFAPKFIFEAVGLVLADAAVAAVVAHGVCYRRGA
jgi:phosphatidylinositol glycan class O